MLVVRLVFFVFAFFVIFVGIGFGESYYYFEPFSTIPSGWWYVATGIDGGLWYGRDGTFPSYGASVREASVNFTGGNLVFDRRVVNASSTAGLGTWVGAFVGFTNKLWNATPYKPFGFEILRKAAQIDPQDGDPSYGNYGPLYANPESRRHAASMSIILAVYSNLNNNSPNYTRFPDQIVFYDMMRMSDNVSNDANTTPHSQWGYWIGSYNRLYTTNVPSLTGASYNVKPILEWNMDDNWVHVTNEGKTNTYGFYQYDNPYPTNTNYIKVMITHDGDKVSFFVNPNPNNLTGGPFNGIPNAMLKLAEVSVGFRSNIFPLMGVETIRFDTERQYVVFDDFYIRTIASAITSEISPYEVGTNSNFTLNVFVKPVFGSMNDSGVSEVLIKKPDTWTSFNWASYTNQIAVMVYSNNILLQTFSKQVGDVNPNSGNVSISIKTISVNNDTLKIRFRATSWADNQIVRPISTSDFANKFIRIVISNISPSDVASGEIEIYCDNPKYGDTWTDTVVGSAPRYATTGKMKSYSGNVLNVTSIDPNLLDGDTLYLSVLGLPKAYGGISPRLVYQGTTNTFYYDISTKDVVEGVYITSVKIVVPPGFTVNPNTPIATNISSLLITNLNNIILTNEGGTNVIYVDYWREGKFIPASDGIDKITIKTFGTPIDITNRFDDWFAYVNNRYVGGIQDIWVAVSTNSTYTSRTVESRRPRAKVEAWITANDDVSKFVENTSISNNYRYVLKNLGLVGNDVIKARIILPSWITNVSDITTTIPANTSFQTVSGTNYIVIDYQALGTNLPAGSNCVISFWGYDNVPPLTNEFTNSFLSQVDNGNGDGYVDVIESSLDWKIAVVTPPARGQAYVYEPNEEGGDDPSTAYHHLYLDDVASKLVKVYVQNIGEPGNDIFRVYVYYPSSIVTNVSDLYSTKIPASYLYLTNISSSNFIVADYNAANDKLLSSQNDTIYFRIRYNVDTYTNITLRVFVANSTNFSKAVPSDLPLDNNQDLHFIFSPINVSSSVWVSNGYIDRATSTNEVKFYITNNGYPKNRLFSLRIQVPSYFSTNVFSVSSRYLSETNGVNTYFDQGLNNIVVNYPSGLLGQSNDVVSVVFVDHLNYSTNVNFNLILTNIRISNESFKNNYSTNLVLSVLVSDPPVSASFGVSNNVINVSTAGEGDYITVILTNRGTGANEITYARIDLPPPLQGKVTNVSGSWTNVSYITYDSTKVEINYSNVTGDAYKGLQSGGVDYINIYFTNYNTSVSTNGISLWVDNSPDFPPLTNVTTLLSGYSSNVYVVQKAMFKVSPNTVNVAEEFSDLQFILTAGLGFNVKKARIVLDYPFVTNGISANSTRGATISYGSNYVEFLYPSGLIGGQFDRIDIRVKDVYSEITNYTNYTISYVDYNDGKGWKETIVDPSGTNMIVFRYETAIGEGYVEPNVVGEDFDSYTYTFRIKNLGLPGNNIIEAQILFSDFITNVSSVNSSILGNANIDILSDRVVLKYHLASTNIPPSYEDVVTLVGLDSISDTSSVGGLTNSVWTIRINNTTNPLSYVNALVTSGKSLNHTIVRPNYNAQVYLEMSNSITSYPQDRHKVYTTSELTNVMYYYVYNYSGSGNNIQKVFITIPSIDSIVLTNGMTVTSLRGTSYLSNNGEIVVEYSTAILPGENDIITVKFKDNFHDGETNIYWNAEISFDSTAGKRKPTGVVAGKVKYVSFVMPLPYAKGAISSPNPKEIFVSDGQFSVSYVLTNTGVDKNVIRGIRIGIPSVFSIVSVSNDSDATNKISGNSLYVFYTNALEVGQGKEIFITLSNTISYPTNVSLNAVVWNSKNTNYVESVYYGADTIKIASLPSYYVYPNQVDTSYYYTNYSVYVKNDSSGSKSIKRLKFVLPYGWYNSISNLQSYIIQDDATYISNFGNTNIEVYYDLEGKEIAIGDQDIITFYGYDNFSLEDTNYILMAYFDDGSGVWRKLKVFIGYTNQVNFVMPPAMADVSINPDYIYVSEVSNVIRLDVTNKGIGSNKIRRLRFTIPYGFTGFSVLSNTIGGIASNYISGNMMYVYYSNDSGISEGEMDSIYFETSSMFDVLTNVSFVVNVGNRNDNVWYVCGTMSGGTTLLRVIYPPLLILGYVNKGKEIYTINTNAHIEYKIVNKSRDIYVTNVLINFDTTNFTITSIKAYTLDPSDVSITNFATIITNVPNTIELRFSPTDLGFNKESILSIDVIYNITNYYPISMTGFVWVYGATNTNTLLVKPSGLPQVVWVTNAPFGRVIGYVTPYRYPVTIKQVDSQGNVIKDAEGNDIVVVSTVSNGYFYIPQVYPDDNNVAILSFENPNYRPMTKVFNVEKNKNNFVGTVTMLNKPFSKSSQQDQDIVSASDNVSKVIVKVGSIQRDFSVDLYVTNLTELQKLAVKNDDKIAKPSTYDNMKGYYLDIRGYSYEEIIKEIGISGDIILYLYYPSVVSNYYDNEDKLGIYYWKETTGDWIRIGGLVDKQNKFIVAKVSYLHKYYGIFETSKSFDSVIRNVNTSSKVITPFVKGQTVDPAYGVVKISFEFDKPYSKYEVLIYNLEGRIVKRIVKEDPEGYVNGEIGWDGKDMDGKPVRNGVYIYRIKVEDKVYTGTIVLVK